MTMPFSPYLLNPSIMRSLQMPRAQMPVDPGMSTWDKMQQQVAPAPTTGLLGEQDVKNARNQGLLDFGLSLLAQSGPTTQPVSFGQAIGLAGKSGLQAYRGALDNATQEAQQKQAFDINKLKMVQEQTNMAQSQKAQAARDAVFQKLPPPADNSDPQAILQWTQQAIPALVAAGDYDGAARLDQLQKSMAGQHQAVQTAEGLYDYDQNTGNYTRKVDVGMNPDQLELKRLQLAEQRARTGAMQETARQSALRTQTSGFFGRKDVKDIMERAPILNQAILTVTQAGQDPALYKSAIANFVQAADQKAQLRSQMLAFFSNLDPSIGGKWESLKSKLLEGKLPAYQRGAMLRHLNALKALSTHEYEQRRAGEVKRHPGLDGWLPPADELFDGTVAPPTGYDPESLTSQYGGLQ